MKKPFNIMQHYHYVPSERKRGLDALSDSERPYYRPNNNSFVKAEEQGLVPCSEFMDLKIFYCKIRGMGACPPFRVQGFRNRWLVVKLKNRPFNSRFKVRHQINIISYMHYVPSERKRGLDALSVSERPYYRPNNIGHARFRGMGACPPFRVCSLA